MRQFLRWAHHRKLACDLNVPKRRVEQPRVSIEDDERLQQLRRCAQDETIPLAAPVVGSLVLRLTTEDVSLDEAPCACI
ncbi:hypothetical protein RKD29_006092 [Streptomyces tendae]|uniref:hypothetical protein n=1 Tax=Streptomyces tendae TaxID=1932 RepID=UPI0038351D6D